MAGLALDVYSLLSYLGTTLFTVALLPQMIRTYKLGHADDLSVWFLVTVILASLSSMIWAVSIPNFVVAAGFLANVIVWGYVLKVRLRPTHPVLPPTP